MNRPSQQLKTIKSKPYGAKEAREKLQAMSFAIMADGLDRLMRSSECSAA